MKINLKQLIQKIIKEKIKKFNAYIKNNKINKKIFYK